MERLSRLGPLINKKFALGLRGYEPQGAGSRDEIDNLIAALRDDESKRLERYRNWAQQAAPLGATNTERRLTRSPEVGRSSGRTSSLGHRCRRRARRNGMVG